jgi:hypothetical protein
MADHHNGVSTMTNAHRFGVAGRAEPRGRLQGGVAAFALVLAVAWPIAAAPGPQAQDAKASAPQPPVSTTAKREPRQVGPGEDLKTLALVKAVDGRAVVRFGPGTLEVVRVGDRLGRNRAEIVLVGAGVLVLDERSTDARGRVDRAEVVIRDGETGGQRYTRRAGDPPVLRKPVVIDGAGQRK